MTLEYEREERMANTPLNLVIIRKWIVGPLRLFKLVTLFKTGGSSFGVYMYLPKFVFSCRKRLEISCRQTSNLLSKHVPTDGLCSLCRLCYTTTSHSIFFCHEAKMLWKESVFWSCLRHLKGASFVECGIVAREWRRKDMEVLQWWLGRHGMRFVRKCIMSLAIRQKLILAGLCLYWIPLTKLIRRVFVWILQCWVHLLFVWIFRCRVHLKKGGNHTPNAML